MTVVACTLCSIFLGRLTIFTTAQRSDCQNYFCACLLSSDCVALPCHSRGHACSKHPNKTKRWRVLQQSQESDYCQNYSTRSPISQSVGHPKALSLSLTRSHGDRPTSQTGSLSHKKVGAGGAERRGEEHFSP